MNNDRFVIRGVFPGADLCQCNDFASVAADSVNLGVQKKDLVFHLFNEHLEGIQPVSWENYRNYYSERGKPVPGLDR